MAQAQSAAPVARGPKMLRALNSRNFRLYFIGQLVSLSGTWMQMVAMQWLVYRLTDSALMLGIIGFAGQIPTFLLGPVAGVAADRWNRRNVQVVTQTLMLLQALVLAVLVWTSKASVWQVLVLSVLLGVMNAFDAPARQAFMVELVDRKEDLANAIAISSIMFNMARLVGPTIAGLLIATIGEGGCFLLNGVSFVAVIIALLMMRIPHVTRQARKAKLWEELKEGAAYTFGFVPVRMLMLFLALNSVLSMPLQTLAPVLAKDVLHGSSAMLGLLVGASGVGSLLGGVYLAQRTDVLGLEQRIALSVGTSGLAIVVIAFSRSLWLVLPMAIVAGLGFMMQGGSSNTLVQTLVEDDKRGRVMAFYTMAFMGMMPFGSLIGGALGDRIGAPNTMLVTGVIMVLGALWFASRLDIWRQHAHPVYERKGMLGADGPGRPSDEG